MLFGWPSLYKFVLMLEVRTFGEAVEGRKPVSKDDLFSDDEHADAILEILLSDSGVFVICWRGECCGLAAAYNWKGTTLGTEGHFLFLPLGLLLGDAGGGVG